MLVSLTGSALRDREGLEPPTPPLPRWESSRQMGELATCYTTTSQLLQSRARMAVLQWGAPTMGVSLGRQNVCGAGGAPQLASEIVVG